ncbi:MAG: tetratricopeptide repeat protein [Elusimicrobiota bacterium]
MNIFYQRTFFALIILALLNPLYGDSSERAKGLKYFRLNDYENAVDCFQTHLGKNPGDKEIEKKYSLSCAQLASQYAEKNLLSAAIEYGKKALKFANNSTGLRKNLALYYNNYALSLSSTNARQANDYLREALKYDRDNVSIKNNLSFSLAKEAKNDYEQDNLEPALKKLLESLVYNPQNINSCFYLGEIYYKKDDLNQAIKYWENVLKINPGQAGIEERIKKAKNENQVETKFNFEKFVNFKVKFEGYENVSSAWRILIILEEARSKLGADFRFYPKAVLTVIVYSDQQFKAVTGGEEWMSGVYDGKIRVRIGESTHDEENLRKLLYHEYTHALIYEIAKNNIPVWLNEGLAQFAEPQKNNIIAEEKALREKLRKEKLFSLADLDKVFLEKKDADQIRIAYLEAKSFVYRFANVYGSYSFYGLLDNLGKGKNIEAVFKEVFFKNLADLEKEWRAYLAQE